MSILDGLPKSDAEWQQAIGLVLPLVDRIEPHLQMTLEQTQAWALVRQGVPLGDLIGLTEQHRDVILAHGCQLIKTGQPSRARALLLQLIRLYPHDARVIYATGVSFQVEGDIATAAKLFVFAAAMNAHDVEAFLRLGECLLVAKEFEGAAGAFKMAGKLHKRGHGSRKAGDYARRMIAHARARVAETSGGRGAKSDGKRQH